MSNLEGKFDECPSCIFFSKKRENPFCKSCNAGEFFEEKIISRRPTENELMIILGRMMNDD
jgi:hypothetical protein